MEEQSAYLKRLKFDASLLKNWAWPLITNARVMVLIVLGILITGIFGLVNLPRRINPQIEIPIIFVSTVYPGAGPADVEELITLPLEEAIEGVEGIAQLTSNSQDNFSSIVVEFDSNIDRDEAKADVLDAVSGVQNLPTDAQKPLVTALDFEDVPVVIFALVSYDDTGSLMQFSRNLKERLEKLPEIDTVAVSGLEQSEVEVLLSPAQLALYGINPVQLSQTLKNSLRSYPVGEITTGRLRLPLNIEGSEEVLTTLRKLPINSGGKRLILGDVADITIRSSPNQPQSFFATADTKEKRSVTFSVYKTLSADLESAAFEAKSETQKIIDESGKSYQMVILNDFDKDIDDQFNGLLEDFGQSISLVFLTLLLFLGLRQAVIASFVIPLSFFASFAAMYAADIQLSFLSLFALLLGLGMIVDDTIVMIAAMTDYYASKKFTPKQTAMLVWRDFLTPTLTGNLINIWSFLPLLLATGIIGEFTKVISFVVTIALLGSTIIALLVTIPFMMAVLPAGTFVRFARFIGWGMVLIVLALGLSLWHNSQLFIPIILALVWVLGIAVFNKKKVAAELKSFRFVRFLGRSLKKPHYRKGLSQGFVSAKGPIRVYHNLLERILASKRRKRQVLLGVVGLAIFSYLLVPLGVVKNEFFPKTDADSVFVSIELPVGTPLEITQNQGLSVLDQLRSIPDADYVLMDIGADVDMSSRSLSNQNTNRIRYSLTLAEDRSQTSFAIAQELRSKLADFQEGEVRVVEMSAGPPSGADLQLTLFGEDLGELQIKAEEVKRYLVNKTGTTNVEISIVAGAGKMRFTPDWFALMDKNVTIDQIGLAMRLFTSGWELDRIAVPTPECIDECPVRLRIGREILPADSLNSIYIQNQDRHMVPLGALGNFSLQENPTQITRLNGQRSIAISAAVLPGYNIVEMGKELEDFAIEELNLASGYSWQTGGINEENTRSVNSILQAMGVSALLILATMVLQLGSFKKALLVMLVIPLAVSGVFVVFGLIGTPLSFPALIGVLALFGIVVKNAILIIDKINRNLDIGIPFTQAVTDGSSSRLEPIFFSSLTNIIGLIPITLSDPLWRGLGGAIIAGLSMSGIIMLFFIPVVYDYWYRKRYTLL